VTVEDSMAMVHISYGMKEPPSPHLRSECAAVPRSLILARAERWERSPPDGRTREAGR